MSTSLAEVIQERGLEAVGRFYSKYRAIVIDNTDDKNMHRLKIICPQVGLDSATWAYPCDNEGSTQAGFKWITPKKGAIVYVEFQMGDPLYPLWSYHSWGLGEMPEELTGPDVIGFVTPRGHSVTLNDVTGELMVSLKSKSNTEKEVIGIYSKEDELTLRCKVLKVEGEVVVTGEVTAGINKVKLTKHLHPVPNGTSSKPL